MKEEEMIEENLTGELLIEEKWKEERIVEERKTGKKKKKSEEGIYVNVPGRIRVTVSHGIETLISEELSAGQFGNVELLSEELFNRRYITHISLNPTHGGVEKLESEQTK